MIDEVEFFVLNPVENKIQLLQEVCKFLAENRSLASFSARQ